MDELDSWMRRYINGYRLKFINKMTTELFIEGFPGLQDYIRNRAKNVNHYEGYFRANSILLDSITKIDDFPVLFINFCEEHSINTELVNIVRTGIEEYQSRFRNPQGRQNLMGNRNNGHRESTPIRLPLNNGDQGSTSQVSSSQDSTAQDSTSQDSTAQDSTSQVSSSQDSTAQDSTSQDSTSQDSTSQDSTSQDSTSQNILILTGVFQNQNDNVNEENLIITGNNGDETTHGALVSHEGCEKITDDVTSEENAACLVNVLECTLNGLKGAEGNAEVNLSDAEVEMPCPCPYHTNVVDENLNDSNANTEQGHEFEASSCSASFSSDIANMQEVENESEIVSSHTIIQRVENELETVSSHTNIQRVENESETVSSHTNIQRLEKESETVSSDTNMQRDEPILPSYKINVDKLLSKSTPSAFDPNMDRRNPVQKTSQGNKTAFMAENMTSSREDVSDDTNNLSQESNSERKNCNLKNNIRKCSPDNQFQEGLVSVDKNLLENLSPNGNTTGNDQSEITHDSESLGSYYLSTSDEEDLLPETDHNLDIDSLKENLKLSSHYEEPVLRIHSPLVKEDNFQKFRCLENSTAAGDNFNRGEPSQMSEVKFVVHREGPSGIECQEDLDKFEPEAHTEKRVENGTFWDKDTKHGGTQLECSSENNHVLTDVKYELTANNHEMSYSFNTVVKTVDGEDVEDRQTSITYGSSNTGPNVSRTSLTDSISSETDLKEANEKDTTSLETDLKKINEIDESSSQQEDCEGLQMQYNPDDFHFLHITTSMSNGKEPRVSSNLMDRTSSPLAVTHFLASDYSGSSEGFQIQEYDDLEAAYSDPSSVGSSSNDVTEDSQPFVSENHILEPCGTETVSMPWNTLGINTSNLTMHTHSDSQHQSNTHCQTMMEDNSTSPELSQNDGSDQNLNFSAPVQLSSENSSLEGVQSSIAAASSATVSNNTNFLGLAIRILECFFPELNIRS